MDWKSASLPDEDEWLAAFRRMVQRQEELFAHTQGIEARTVYDGVGAGGDRSLVIDRDAEQVVFDELERIAEDGAAFVVVSEERGEVRFGEKESPIRVVVDPIDGSLNARRTLPSFALSVAVSSGGSMADVELGFVHDFGAREEFSAVLGGGARLAGQPLLARGSGYGLELVGVEGSEPSRVAPLIAGLAGKAFRVRAVGSLAITLCYVAAGRFDAMISARASRSVDIAAAQLIAREAGAVVRFGELELAEADLGLEARYGIAAGLDQEMLDAVLAAEREAVEGAG